MQHKLVHVAGGQRYTTEGPIFATGVKMCVTVERTCAIGAKMFVTGARTCAIAEKIAAMQCMMEAGVIAGKTSATAARISVTVAKMCVIDAKMFAIEEKMYVTDVTDHSCANPSHPEAACAMPVASGDCATEKKPSPLRGRGPTEAERTWGEGSLFTYFHYALSVKEER